jgi:hypothetical protein
MPAAQYTVGMHHVRGVHGVCHPNGKPLGAGRCDVRDTHSSPPWTKCLRLSVLVHWCVLGMEGVLSTLSRPCTHPPSLAVSCAGPSTRVCTDMVVLRGIHSGCCPHHPFVLDVGAFGMHEVHSVRHSGGEPLGAGDTTFGVCVPSPP